MVSRNVSLTCKNSITFLKTVLFDTYETKKKIKENRYTIKKKI